MLKKELYPKAYKEVMEILKYIPEEETEKIPAYILNHMKQEMDEQYEYQVEHFDDFKKQPMLEETETILAVLFRDYWATEEQRERIKAKEKYDIQLIEEEKRKKYNPNNLFQNKPKYEVKIEANLPVEVKKESFFKKLISYIRRMLK